MPEIDPDQQAARDALAKRLFGACIGALDLLHVYVGDRLGLYRALAGGPATTSEVARRCGIHERYAREWLEQQAVAGILAPERERLRDWLHALVQHFDAQADGSDEAVLRRRPD